MTDFICPVDNPRLTSKYGMRLHPVLKVNRLHAGVDLVSTKMRNPVIFASADGTVRLVKNTGNSGYGKYVIITHSIKGVKYETVYAHLDSYSVKVGQKIKQGEKLGIMGNTGIGTGSHLHFEIHKGTYNYANGTYPTSLNPLKFINLGNNQNTDKDVLTLSQYKELLAKIEKLDKEKLDKPTETTTPSPSHKEAWEWLVDTAKLSDGSNAKGYMTREQFASLLKRYHDKFVAK